jgi:hypothetical protein
MATLAFAPFDQGPAESHAGVGSHRPPLPVSYALDDLAHGPPTRSEPAPFNPGALAFRRPGWRAARRQAAWHLLRRPLAYVRHLRVPHGGSGDAYGTG